jgi:hypothetical protein
LLQVQVIGVVGIKDVFSIILLRVIGPLFH